MSKMDIRTRLDEISKAAITLYSFDEEKTRFTGTRKGKLLVQTSFGDFSFLVDKKNDNAYYFTPKSGNKKYGPKHAFVTSIRGNSDIKNAFLSKFQLFRNSNFELEVSGENNLRLVSKENDTKISFRVFKTGETYYFVWVNEYFGTIESEGVEKLKANFLAKYPAFREAESSIVVNSLSHFRVIYPETGKTVSVAYKGLDNFVLDPDCRERIAYYETISYCKKRISEIQDYSNEIFRKYRPWVIDLIEIYADNPKRSFKLLLNSKYEDVELVIEIKTIYALDPNVCFTNLLGVIKNQIKEKVKNYIPPSVTRKIKSRAKKILADKDDYTVNLDLFEEMVQDASPYKITVIGDKQWENIVDLHKKMKNKASSVTYDSDSNAFVFTNGFYTVTFASDFTFKEVKEVKVFGVGPKKQIEQAFSYFAYFATLRPLFEKLEEMECYAKNTIVCDGISNKSVKITFYHFKSFSVLFDFPSISSFEGKTVKEIKQELKPLVKEKEKEIKAAMKIAEKEALEEKRKNSLLFQSHAAQTIFDFLAGEPVSFSESGLVNYLVSGTRGEYPITENGEKFAGVLKQYKKEYIKSLIKPMVNAKILMKEMKKGNYCDYDAYFADETSKQDKVYFNSYTRTKTEIKKELKAGKSVSLSESLLMLEEMKEGKVKEKDMACLFNLLRNYEFVLNYQKEIKEAFASLPPNVLLYIPFIIDEFEPRSLEKKILNEMIPKKRKKKEEVV